MSVIESIIDIPAEHEKKIYGNFDENIKKIEKFLLAKYRDCAKMTYVLLRNKHLRYICRSYI